MALLRQAASDERDPAPGTIGADSFARLGAVDLADLPRPDIIRARDGLDMACRWYAAGEDGATLAVVALHGSAGHGGHLHRLAAAIAATGVADVVVPDLRGHGLSGARRGHAVAYPEQMADDLDALIAAVRQRLPRRAIVLVGHSAGGGLALRRCDSVDAVALLAPFFGARAPTTRPALGGWVRMYGPRVRALVELNRGGVTWLNHLTAVEFEQPFATRDGRETLAWSFNTMLAFGPGHWKHELAALPADAPLLLLVGERDECFRPDAYAAALAEAAPQGRVEVLPGLGHWDLLVAEEVAEILMAWLAAIP